MLANFFAFAYSSCIVISFFGSLKERMMCQRKVKEINISYCAFKIASNLKRKKNYMNYTQFKADWLVAHYLSSQSM